jgi:two-component system, response regulator
MINKTVLLVERNLEEAEKITRFFREFKFRNRIQVVQSKAEALDYIFGTGAFKNREDREKPGLIFLDLETNKTKDVNTLRPLQDYLSTQSIPLIILTSSAEQENEIGEYQLGAVGFIRKPLDFTHLIEVIQYMGFKWKEEIKGRP